MKDKAGKGMMAGMAAALLVLAGCGAGSGMGGNLSEGGTGITNIFDSPAEMGVGDIMPIELESGDEVTVDFSGVASGAKFILALGSYSSDSRSSSIEVSGNLAAAEGDLAKGMVADIEEAPADEDGGFGAQEMMSAWLRAAEHALPSTAVPKAQMGGAKAMAVGAKAVSVGSTETFRVLSSLSSKTSYVNVTGEVRCVGSNVVFYVEAGLGDNIISDDEVDALCSEFDGVAANEKQIFGDISDVDGDGRLAVLMTSQINKLGALGGGIVTGYFYAGDLYDRDGSNPVSNEREIVFTLVPNPDGSLPGSTLSKSFTLGNLLPAVLPHEMQHAISYNQHVFVSGGDHEDDWLNEGMSHLAEDVMGYGMENPSRYAMYLASPSTYGVVTGSSPNLMERGASYLFMRFMYEQAKDKNAFLRALETTAATGVDNLEQAAAAQTDMAGFSQMIARWVVALGMTNRGISQDRRYTYQPRVQNASTGNWEGVCIDCDAQDGRGTYLEGVHLNQYKGSHHPTIDASTAIFYDISSVPDSMVLAGTPGGGNFGILIRTE